MQCSSSGNRFVIPEILEVVRRERGRCNVSLQETDLLFLRSLKLSGGSGVAAMLVLRKWICYS